MGKGRKINKKSPGASCTGGEGWVVEQEARRGNPEVRRRESEGSGIAGGTSWVVGTGALELGRIWECPGRRSGRENERKKNKRISHSPTSELGYKVYVSL